MSIRLRTARVFIFPALLFLGLLGCNSTTPDEQVERAVTLIGQQELTAATIELKNALQNSPNHITARVLLGNINLEMGDYASALTEFERAIDLGAPSELIQLELLRSKLGLGRFQEVIDSLEPQDTLAQGLQTMIAEAYRQSGDVLKAKW